MNIARGDSGQPSRHETMFVSTQTPYKHICPHCQGEFNYYARRHMQKICPLCGREINENSSTK